MDEPRPKPRAPKATLWDALAKFPPYFVRLLARKQHGMPLEFAEIAITSGLDYSRVAEISLLKSWDSLTVGEIKRYTLGCNFDPTCYEDRAKLAKYDYQWKSRNSCPFTRQRQHPKWESEFLPSLLMLQSELKKKSLAA